MIQQKVRKKKRPVLMLIFSTVSQEPVKLDPRLAVLNIFMIFRDVVLNLLLYFPNFILNFP